MMQVSLIEPGKDWRSLTALRVEGGMLADYAIMPEQGRHGGFLGVTRWSDPSALVTGRGHVTTGRFSVADPRIATSPGYDISTAQAQRGSLGILRSIRPCNALPLAGNPGSGLGALAPPRTEHQIRFDYRIVPRPQPGSTPVADLAPTLHARPGAGVRAWTQPAGTITSQRSPLQGAFSVSDPRPTSSHTGGGKYAIAPWNHTSRTVIAASSTGNGASAVADASGRGPHTTSTPIPANQLPGDSDRVVVVIQAASGHWHRPFTTLELSALQSLTDAAGSFALEGDSDTAWRLAIGNAVPPSSAEAIAETIGRTLLMAKAGTAFALSSVPIWVRPIAAALTIDTEGHLGHCV